jgi:light-regulated signal transduction histidine kinase (bacteriophytochrome)
MVKYERDIQLVERSLEFSSEMKETYLKLEQKKQEIQTSNDALRRYAYIVSHDLRGAAAYHTPATSSSLELRLGDELDGETREFINYSVSGVERLKGMLEAVLNYSQLENRKAFMSVGPQLCARLLLREPQRGHT